MILRFPTLPVLSIALLAGASAYANDSCTDYFQRHYKADIEPVSATAAEVPRQGDLAAFQMLTVAVKNVGNRPIAGQTGGFLPAKPMRIVLERASGREVYTGQLNVPLDPGAVAKVGLSLPSGHLRECEKVTVRIDDARSVGQFGCQVYNNDVNRFQIRKRKGMFLCAIRPVPWGARPGNGQ